MKRTPLIETPVPIDWPRRPGFPPPGVERAEAYPARTGPTTKPTVDMTYPNTVEGRRLAKAHAWMFPSKRIKVGKKVLSTGDDVAANLSEDSIRRLKRLVDTHGVAHPLTVDALRAAVRDARTPDHYAYLRSIMPKVIHHQVQADLKRGNKWLQMASADLTRTPLVDHHTPA